LLHATEPRFDVVLVLRVFDYLRDAMVRRSMRVFHALLRAGGLCLTSNLHVANPHRNLMENVAASDVLQRTAIDFEALMVIYTGSTTREPTADPCAANLRSAGPA
jgi:hypothetical protein